MKLSIIVPVYNVEKYLDECIQSIIDQTFKDFELILVDDGSPDNCPEMCDTWADKDSRIKVIHKKNGGLRSAVFTGIDAASGEYCGFVDSDDWIKPQMYEELLLSAEKYNADIVQCGIQWYSSTNSIFRKSEKEVVADKKQCKEVFDNYFLHEGELSAPFIPSRVCKIYKKNILLSAKENLNEKLSYGEDLTLFLNALNYCNKRVVLKESVFYMYRYNEQSIVNIYNKKNFQQACLLAEELAHISQLYNISGNGTNLRMDVVFCSTAVSVISSNLQTTEKIKELKKYLSKISDKKNIIKYAMTQPLKGKICYCLFAFNVVTPTIYLMDFIYKIMRYNK